MKYTLLFAISIFLLLSPSVTRSQNAGENIVYLKNGSILCGKILENLEGKYVRIEIIGNNQLVIPYQEIKKVVSDSNIKGYPNSKRFPVEVANSVNFYGGNNTSAGFSILSACRFRNRVGTGIGTGIDVFDYQVLPVYVEVNHCLLKGNLTPFVYGRTGFSFPLSKAASDQWTNPEYKGGILAGIGAGIRQNFNDHYSLIFSVGYRYQKLRMVTDYNPWYGGGSGTQTIERIDEYNRINVSIGFLFK